MPQSNEPLFGHAKRIRTPAFVAHIALPVHREGWTLFGRYGRASKDCAPGISGPTRLIQSPNRITKNGETDSGRFASYGRFLATGQTKRLMERTVNSTISELPVVTLKEAA